MDFQEAFPFLFFFSKEIHKTTGKLVFALAGVDHNGVRPFIERYREGEGGTNIVVFCFFSEPFEIDFCFVDEDIDLRVALLVGLWKENLPF